jgi:hypothetical protein
MYCMPDTEEEHLPIVRQLIDLGVDWLYVTGRGQTVAQAREWIERYRESVLDRIVD